MVSGHQRMTSERSLTPHAFATNAAAAKKPGQLQRASRSGTADPVRSMKSRNPRCCQAVANRGSVSMTASGRAGT